MPDEAITAPSAGETSFDAPAADTPNEAPVSPDGQGTTNPTDAPDDVINMRADYTRKTQELAEQRREWEAQQAEQGQFRELVENALVNQDEEAIQALLGEIGLDFEDDGNDAANPEVARLESQLNELNEWRNEQQQEAQARDNAIHIEREFMRLGMDGWDDGNPAHNAILQFAFSHEDPANPGQTNVEAGFQDYQKLRDHVIEELKQSKQAPSSDQFGSPASAALPENASLAERAAAAMERNGFG